MQEEESRPITVVVADDHPMIRDVVRYACADRASVEIVGLTADGPETLELCRRLRPDVLLLDLTMPGMTGIEVAQTLRDEGSPTRILVLTGRDDGETVLEAMRAGVAGYLDKTVILDDVVEAIEAVARGESRFGRHEELRVHARLGHIAHRARRGAEASSGLTPREREVLTYAAAGLSGRQIATRLGVSERTVESHLANLYAKLEVRTRVQALHEAARLGLVDLGERSARSDAEAPTASSTGRPRST